MPSPYKALQLALAIFGLVFLLLYPLALLWPSGWAWHHGPPYESDYFMMIVGVYATLGVFLLNAARNPQAHLSLIWFTVVSSVVHAALMAVQAFGSGHHIGHLLGDVPALLLVAVVLAVLVLASGLESSASAGTDPGVKRTDILNDAMKAADLNQTTNRPTDDDEVGSDNPRATKPASQSRDNHARGLRRP
jgi:hypothetical protein